MAEDTVTRDVQHMQQEAARRVNRMQEHTRRIFEEHQGRTPESLRAAQPSQYAPPPLYRRPTETERGQPGQKNAPILPSGKGISPHWAENAVETGKGRSTPTRECLEGITEKNTFLGGLDTEQLLLLGLALLLFRNGCRVELVLALLYLAM